MTRGQHRVARAKRLGVCIDCTVKVVPGRSRCQYHLDYNKRMSQNQRKKRAKEGRCIDCGRPVPEGLTTRCWCVDDKNEAHAVR